MKDYSFNRDLFSMNEPNHLMLSEPVTSLRNFARHIQYRLPNDSEMVRC